MASLIMFDGILRLGGPREALPSSLSSLGHSLLCIVVCGELRGTAPCAAPLPAG